MTTVVISEKSPILANAIFPNLELSTARILSFAALSMVLLSRVITGLGQMPAVDTRVVEGLYTPDLAYLQDLYERINQAEVPVYRTVCPHCGEEITVPINFMEAGL